jgi:hypothetical protein
MAAVEVLPSGKVVAAPSERAKGPNDSGPFTKLLDSLPSVFPKVKEDPFGECTKAGAQAQLTQWFDCRSQDDL